MASPWWTFVPKTILDTQKRMEEAKSWASQQQQQLAADWAALQEKQAQEHFENLRQSTSEMLRQNVPGVAGGQDLLTSAPEKIGQAGEYVRENVPGYAGAEKLANEYGPYAPYAGPLLAPVVKPALEWEQQNVATPIAEYAVGPEIRGEVGLGDTILNAAIGPGGAMLRRAAGDIASGASPQERFQSGGEIVPGLKGVAPMIFDPLNALPMSPKGITALGRAAEQATPEIGRVGRALLAGERGGGIPFEGLGKKLSPEDIAKGKVSAKTGFTKGQEQYLAGKLEEVAPTLPTKTGAVTDQKSGTFVRSEGQGTTIKVPGDGNVTVYSQQQAQNLHNFLTGKRIENLDVLPQKIKGTSRETRIEHPPNKQEVADQAMRIYGRPEAAAAALRRQLDNIYALPEEEKLKVVMGLDTYAAEDAVKLLEERATGKVAEYVPPQGPLAIAGTTKEVPYNVDTELKRLGFQPRDATPAPVSPAAAPEPVGQTSVPEAVVDEFIRAPTKAEKVGGTARSRGFNSIPDREGYQKVYGPYGEEGPGYYYRKLPSIKAKQEPVAPETPPTTTMPPKAAEMPPETATGAIERTVGKEPWEMTKAEFNDKAIFRGVTPGTENKPNGGWTNRLSYARINSPHEGGKIRVAWKSDVPTDALGAKTVEDIIAENERLGAPGFYLPEGYNMPVRAEVADTADVHRALVEQALREGKPVPQAVMNNYPDLAAKAPAPAATVPETVPQTDTVASVPVMITRQMEADLKGLGYVQREIDAMKPQEAWDILQAKSTAPPTEPVAATTKPAPTQPVPPTTATQPTLAGAGKSPTLPSDLAGAKPRYKEQVLNFQSDVDKALYIVGNDKSLSKRDADYMKWLQEALPDRSESELRAMGRVVRTYAPKAIVGAGDNVVVTHAGIQKELARLQKLQEGTKATPKPVQPNLAPTGAPRTPLWEQGADTAKATKGARAEGVGIRAPEIQTGPRPNEAIPPGGKPPGGQGNMQPTPPDDSYGRLVDALTPTKKTLGERWTDTKESLLRGFYDKTMDLKPVEEATGVPTYKLAAVVNGSTAYGEALVEKQVRPVFDAVKELVPQLEQYMVGMRLRNILAKNPHAKLPGNIDGWRGALRALDGVEQRLSPEQLTRVKDAAAKLWQLNDDLILKPRLEAGLLSKQQYIDIKNAHPNYISFYREDFKGLQTGTTGNLASVSSAGLDLMDLAGSTRKLDNPLARFEAAVIHTQHLASENRAAKAMAGALVKMEDLKAPKGSRVPLKTGETWGRVLEKNEPGEHSQIWDTISYMDKGEKVSVQVPKVYADIAKKLEAETADAVTSVLRAASAPLRHGAVTYNPAFLIKNPIRDAVSAFYREGLNPFSKEYMEGWAAAISKNADFMEAAKSGALMSGIVDTQRTTEALSRAKHLGEIRVDNAKDALLLIPRLIERANMIGEQATRIATYKKLRAQGLGELEAAVRARDVSVDFAKSGNVMKLINQVIPFSNAGVQGAANTLRTLRYNPKQAIIAATPLGMASILAYVTNQRFETFKDVPDYERDNNWIIMLGEGEKARDPKSPNKAGDRFPIYAKIPKGPLGAFLTAPVEVLLNLAWQKDDRSVVEHLLRGVRTATMSLSPIEPSLSGVLPPIASTGVGLGTGFDTYRQQPIVPRGEQERPPELQAGAETSRAAVALGERFNISPRLLEWAIKDYGAGVGGQGLWLIDAALGALGYDPALMGEAKQKNLTGTEQLVKTPIISSFVGSRNTGQQTVGWERYDKAVMDAKREFAAIPELRELGISTGGVGETITLGKTKVQLQPDERAKLQRETTITQKIMVKTIVRMKGFQQWPDVTKTKLIQRAMDRGREIAQKRYLGRLSKEDLSRRAVEGLPVAVGQ